MASSSAVLRSESGYPYIMFEGNVNAEHANGHVSKVKFSNLCSEVLHVKQKARDPKTQRWDNARYTIMPISQLAIFDGDTEELT